jgi:hypothetical protein
MVRFDTLFADLGEATRSQQILNRDLTSGELNYDSSWTDASRR